MGRPIALRIAGGGFPVTVWNRSRGPAESLAAARWRGRAAATPAEAARDADVVITMLTDGPAVLAVLDGPDGVLAGLAPGAVVVDCSTTGAEYARQAAALCRDGRRRLPRLARSAAAPSSPSAASSASWSAASPTTSTGSGRCSSGSAHDRARRADRCRRRREGRRQRAAAHVQHRAGRVPGRRRRRPACPRTALFDVLAGGVLCQHVRRLQAGGLPRSRGRARSPST